MISLVYFFSKSLYFDSVPNGSVFSVFGSGRFLTENRVDPTYVGSVGSVRNRGLPGSTDKIMLFFLDFNKNQTIKIKTAFLNYFLYFII